MPIARIPVRSRCCRPHSTASLTARNTVSQLVLNTPATSFQLMRLAQHARNHAYVVVIGLLPLAHGTVSTVTPQRGQSTRRIAYAQNTSSPHIGTNWKNRTVMRPAAVALRAGRFAPRPRSDADDQAWDTFGLEPNARIHEPLVLLHVVEQCLELHLAVVAPWSLVGVVTLSSQLARRDASTSPRPSHNTRPLAVMTALSGCHLRRGQERPQKSRGPRRSLVSSTVSLPPNGILSPTNSSEDPCFLCADRTRGWG